MNTNSTKLIFIHDLVSDQTATIKLEHITYHTYEHEYETSELRIYQAPGQFETVEAFDEAWNKLPSKLDFFTSTKPRDAWNLAQSIIDMLLGQVLPEKPR